MTFAQTLLDAPVILTEGAVIERLRRDSTVIMDGSTLNASLLYDPEGLNLLRRIYREYLHIGYHHDLPMLVLTPTWRANPERLSRVGLPEVGAVCEEAFRLLDQLREGYGRYSKKIFVGGLLGCRGDAYRGVPALQEEEAYRFHRTQTEALARAGVDFLLASTLPAVSEARGIARALEESALPYLLSFIVRPSGHLLDGTPLEAAIASIDASSVRFPSGYLLNCIHPSIFESALAAALGRDEHLSGRVIGLQANTSAKSPEELDRSAGLECEDPELFAAQMVHLRLEFGTQILGGCCGTDERHLSTLAGRLRELFPASSFSGGKSSLQE